MEVTREIVFPASPDEVWEALTDPEQLEEWFANDVELDAREGGDGVFRWDDGEVRRAKVLVVEPGERLVLDWDDEGEVEFTLEEVEEGTRLLVRESTPEFSTALELRALAFTYALKTRPGASSTRSPIPTAATCWRRWRRARRRPRQSSLLSSR
jgi:uncharacterized protein YndB with AHSA1/START domain